MLLRELLGAAALVVVAAGCDESGTEVAAGGDGAAPGDGASALDASADAPGDAGVDTAEAGDAADGVEARVTALLAQMTLAEKAGQMTMGGYSSLASPDDVTTYGLGALGGAPYDLLPSDWLPITAAVRAKAAATRLRIPVLFAIDAVHGNAKLRGTTVFPQNIGLGCTRDTDLVRQAAVVNAAEVTAVGLGLVEAPDVDVARDERWGRTYESFGEDPQLVASMATAAFTGYRGAVLASAKHYFGAGGTAWGTGVAGRLDQGDDLIDEAEMRAVHLPPFVAAIAAGAQVVMVSYSAWQGTKMTASAKWITDVLEGELGFDGIVMTDGGGALQLGPDVQTDVQTAIGAGIDLVNVAQPYAQVVAAIQALVSSGAIPESRIDASVRRILRVKIRAGLFDAPPPDPSALASVGSAAHRAVARQAVRESLVLLKNDAALLPLPKGARVHVAGLGGNDLGIQSGGWTLAWQGLTGVDATAMGGGTTIVDAMRAAATSPGLVTYSADGSGAAGADVGVVVLHELPYAEYEGDTPDPRFDQTATPNIYDGTAAQVVANMTAAKIPLVLLLVTGRPVRIESMLPAFGAAVAAWLPGSEGAGVADVLYGDAPFTGKLSRSWPRDATPLPFNEDSLPYDPLFPYGFGLTK
jgi:beta-glucosidase